MSGSVRPHRRQPSRLPRPWDSPGKNTGVGCHFLLQCMEVKSESEVAQSCLTLSNRMDCSPPGSSVHGIFRQEHWSGLPFPSPCYPQSLHFIPEMDPTPLKVERMVLSQLFRPLASWELPCLPMDCFNECVHPMGRMWGSLFNVFWPWALT